MFVYYGTLRSYRFVSKASFFIDISHLVNSSHFCYCSFLIFYNGVQRPNLSRKLTGVKQLSYIPELRDL